MKLVKLTHANNRSPVYIVRGLVAGWYWSDAHKASHVVMNGGAVFPALEKLDDVKRLMEADEASTNESAESAKE
jgi:glutamine amidotransferase-like uncharacterized protein